MHTVRHMFRGITDLLSILGQLLPLEVLIPVLVLAGLAALPLWWRSVRAKQIKGQLRRAARARDPEARQAAIEQAFRLTRGRPRLLVALVEHAIRMGQQPVWKRGLEQLEQTGKAELDVAALRRKVEAPPSTVRDPLEAVVRIERLHRAGLHVAAREVLDEALARHPNDPELQGLADTLLSSPTSRTP